MKNPFVWLLLSISTFLPGCLSEDRILQEIKALRDYMATRDTLTADWSGVYSIQYDTTFAPDPAFFATTLDSLARAPKGRQVLSEGIYDLSLKYDSTSGQVFGFLSVRPIHVTGWSTIRLNERIALIRKDTTPADKSGP